MYQMAKVSRRLTILIHPDIDGPEFEKMREQGHTVNVMDVAYTPTGDGDSFVEKLSGYDRIYGGNCYRMFGPLLKFLPVSIKDARMEKYGPPTKAEPTEKKPRKSRKKKDECVEGVPGSDEGGDSRAEEVSGGLEGVRGTVKF